MFPSFPQGFCCPSCLIRYLSCLYHLSKRAMICGNGDLVTSHVARGSYPMSNWKGDVFVVALYQVLCTNSATGKYVIQFVCLWLVQNHKYCSSHWFVHSDWP